MTFKCVGYKTKGDKSFVVPLRVEISLEMHGYDAWVYSAFYALQKALKVRQPRERPVWQHTKKTH